MNSYQNKLVVAEARHAAYVARYISTGLAALAPLRRAYGFSRDFPRTPYAEAQALLNIKVTRPWTGDHVELTEAELIELSARFGIERDDDCVWVPSAELWQ